jgi:hypothetical protein
MPRHIQPGHSSAWRKIVRKRLPFSTGITRESRFLYSNQVSGNVTVELSMNREVSPTALTTTVVVILGCLIFFLWKMLLTPFDNPVPPEIKPGPPGQIAPPPAHGLPSPVQRSGR